MQEAEMEGHLLMSKKERSRQVIFEGVKEGRITLKTASVSLKISYRQCRRSYQRYQKQGAEGLLHASRARPSNRGKPIMLKEAVLQLYQTKFEGFGPTLASEKLAKLGYKVDHETLRRWLLEANLWQKCRKRHVYRRRRERRACFGELVQMDGSHHVWFGEDRKCLMNMVDDATTTTYARLYEEETTEAAMRTLWGWIERYGIPVALYTDRKNVYVTEREPTLEEELAGVEPLTAFGKACSKLGIHIIKACSPQAKGRVERNHGVYQDRFVKELKLENKESLVLANEVLQQYFCDDLNERFACSPTSTQDAHRPVPEGINLADIFCYEEPRVLNNDWTFSYRNNRYQIDKASSTGLGPRSKLTVRTYLAGHFVVLYKDRFLKHHLAGKPRATPKPIPPAKASTAYKPPMSHPYKQASFERMQVKKLRILRPRQEL
jgi:hypothetical protein